MRDPWGSQTWCQIHLVIVVSVLDVAPLVRGSIAERAIGNVSIAPVSRSSNAPG
jgi:hypothetical protein